MGCLHSKTAHLHSPEDPPTALPDAKKPDPGPPLVLFTFSLFVLLLGFLHPFGFYCLEMFVYSFCCCGVCQNLALMSFEAQWGWFLFFFCVGLRKFGFLVCFILF